MSLISKKRTIKDLSATVIANLVNVVVLALSTLVLPKLLNVKEYSYWQLYHFYIQYAGFFHLGWLDGIYLKQGGKYYSGLNKTEMSSQLRLFTVFELIETVIIIAVGMILSKEAATDFIAITFGIGVLLVLRATFLQYLCQSTDRLTEYARVLIIEKAAFTVCLIALAFPDLRNFRTVVIADIISKAVSLGVLIYICRDIVIRKAVITKETFAEAWDNISVGIKVMLANIAGLLLTGIVKLAVQIGWGIEAFGKTSFTMAVSNMIMVFVTAIGTVIYPVIKRIDSNDRTAVYRKLRAVLVVLSLGIMVFYYPLEVIIGKWLPEYTDSVRYMALLFPICYFESKTNMLINPYFKALREEKKMMIFNIISTAICLVYTAIMVSVFKNYDMTILGITIALAFRSAITEMYLNKSIRIGIGKNMIIELALVVVFCITSWKLNNIISTVIYGCLFTIFAIWSIFKYKDEFLKKGILR